MDTIYDLPLVSKERLGSPDLRSFYKTLNFVRHCAKDYTC